MFEFINKCELEVFNLRNKMFKTNGMNLLISNNNKDSFLNLIDDLVVNSDFYQAGVEFDWVNKFVEYVDCVDLEIKTDQAALSLERSLIEINNLRLELNKIQIETKRQEKPIKELLKIKINKILDKYPLINNVNYKFREFVFNYDPKRRSISDRLKELVPISSKAFLPGNLAFTNSVPM